MHQRNDVKKAYSKMALKDHPNKNKSPDTEEKFKEVSKAHVSSTLSITHQRIKRPMCEQKTKMVQECFEPIDGAMMPACKVGVSPYDIQGNSLQASHINDDKDECIVN